MAFRGYGEDTLQCDVDDTTALSIFNDCDVIQRVLRYLGDEELRPFILGLENLLRGHRQSLMATALLILVGGGPLYPQFRSTQWTADSGLPQNIIRSIAQT